MNRGTDGKSSFLWRIYQSFHEPAQEMPETAAAVQEEAFPRAAAACAARAAHQALVNTGRISDLLFHSRAGGEQP